MTGQEWQTALHEAGHAAMAATLGLPVSEVRRWSPDPTRELGATLLPIGDLDRTKARKWALMLAAGPGMSDQPLPEWPLTDTNTTDERLLKVFCDYLELDERGYNELITEMWRLSATKRFDRLFTVLMTWFEHRRTLDEYILTHAKAMVLTWPEGEGE